MYKLDLPVDYKEAAAIERRRNQEEQRKSRIFNSKDRIIGVDKQALEQQVLDRKHLEDRERIRDAAFAADIVRNDKIGQLMQRRQEQDARQIDYALNEFRAMHQQAPSRREYDLYDPDALKKDVPARLGDDDPRCTASGLQKLDGEDLNAKARARFQAEQQREWAEQQARERKQAEANQKQADRLYELRQRELAQRAADLTAAEEACRRAIKQSTADYNLALAREQAARNELRRKMEEDDNLTEVANHVYGDLLTENPAAATSAFGPHRVVPDRWKGMSPEQLDEIKRQQEIQRAEQKLMREEEKRLEAEHDRQRSAQARAAILLERDETRRMRDIQKQTADENKRLADEQKAHLNYLDKEVYTNNVNASYFAQFNTSTR